MSDFSKVASALSRRTHDTVKDNYTDLDIAQASHALKVLKEIVLDRPGLVARALKMQFEPARSLRPNKIRSKFKLQKKRKVRKVRKVRRKQQKAWSALRFSTAHSRYMGYNNG